MADLATMQAELASLKAARTAILRGRSTASASYEGRSVTYRAAELEALNSAIIELEAKISLAQGGPGRSAIGVIF